MPISIHSPGQPRHLRITQSMVEDFLCDPALAAWWIFGIRLDAFQSLRLKYMWWVPEMYDASGISTFKTGLDFIYSCLRAILIANYTNGHAVGVYFPTFQTGKDTFWRRFATFNHPMFRAQLGRVEDPESDDKKAKRKDPGAWTAEFRSGGTIRMPAPDLSRDSANQASIRLGTLVVEEATKFDDRGDSIDKELIGRVSEGGFCNGHPLWGFHFKFLAHAEPMSHPGTQRWKNIKRGADAGDPRKCVFTSSFKDYSNLPDSNGRPFRKTHRADETMRIQRENLQPETYLGQCLGFHAASGSGVYPERVIAHCGEEGKALRLRPMLTRNDPP